MTLYSLAWRYAALQYTTTIAWLPGRGEAMMTQFFPALILVRFDVAA